MHIIITGNTLFSSPHSCHRLSNHLSSKSTPVCPINPSELKSFLSITLIFNHEVPGNSALNSMSLYKSTSVTSSTAF